MEQTWEFNTGYAARDFAKFHAPKPEGHILQLHEDKKIKKFILTLKSIKEED